MLNNTQLSATLLLLIQISCTHDQANRSSVPEATQNSAPPVTVSNHSPRDDELTPSAIREHPQESSIRAVDFRNFTYPWYPSPYRPPYGSREVRLRSGELLVDEVGNDNDLWFGLANISYADLTRDGEEEAIITVVGNTNPNGSRGCTFIYTMGRAAPRLLWSFESGDRAYGGLRRIGAEDGDLVVEHYDPGPEEEFLGAMCCPTRFIRSRHRWDGRRFREISSETLPNEYGDSRFLGYPSNPS